MNRPKNAIARDGDHGLSPEMGNDGCQTDTNIPRFSSGVNPSPEFPPYPLTITGGRICWTISDVIATIFGELETLGLSLSDETLDQIAASVWRKMATASYAPRRLQAWADRLHFDELAVAEVEQ